MIRSLLAVSLAVASLVPSVAIACSPPAAGLTSSLPANGEALAANAPILLSGFGISGKDLTATIDGAPATLSPVVPGPVVEEVSLSLSPAPKPGQTVKIDGPLCDSLSGNCVAHLTFPVVDADTTAPGAIDSLSFDIHDYADVEPTPGECLQPSGLALYARLSAKASATPGTSEYWLVEAHDAGADHKLLASQLSERSGTTGVVSLRLTGDELGGAKLPLGLCLEASSVDVAGNKTPVVTQCLPCRFRDESTGAKASSSPSEPTWTPGDVVAGGSCDAGGSGGSGQAGGAGSGGSAGTSGGPALDGSSSDDGGGCSAAASGARGGAWVGALAALGALAARARRRRGG